MDDTKLRGVADTPYAMLYHVIPVQVPKQDEERSWQESPGIQQRAMQNPVSGQE